MRRKFLTVWFLFRLCLVPFIQAAFLASVRLIKHAAFDGRTAAWFSLHRGSGAAYQFDVGGDATKLAIIAPPSVLASLGTPRKIPFASEMTYGGITVKAYRTPHGDSQHYSYLVLWHGVKLYFTGDTDDVTELDRQAHLDVAFVTPRQLKAMKEHGKRIPAERVVIYHQRAGENVPIYQQRRVLQQGESFDLLAPQLER
jgi:hypothetical protein